jgi:RNA polymerase sigma factor (sigma-70 family)
MMQANMYRTRGEQEMASLYKKYAPGLLSYVRLHIPSAEDAEDLVVDVFLAALEHVTLTACSEKEQQMWLWRVTRNKVIDVYRRAKTRQNVTIEQVAHGLFENEKFSPESAALRHEEYQDLYAYLQRLPPLHQQMLRLRFGQELSCREIAARLGRQENAVRVTLSRSLNRLRNIYQRKREERERD